MLERDGGHVIAAEVKAGSRVQAADLRGLHATQEPTWSSGGNRPAHPDLFRHARRVRPLDLLWS